LDTYNSGQVDLRRDVISGGSTGLIYLLRSGYVRKSAYPGITRKQSLRDIEHEYKIYPRLPHHDRLLKMMGYSIEDGLILEYMPSGNLREYLQDKAAGLSLHQRLQWACDAAEALQLVHSHNIIHCDVKPENFLLDSSLRLRIIDFSGSSIDGSYFSAVEGARFCVPRPWEAHSTVETDMFALGSTIYEIMTGTQPYAEHTDEEVEALFKKGIFPEVDSIPCGELITMCWNSQVHLAGEVRELITTELQIFE
jgi:serine/threonine protein kinase